ncbi:hypothetical protein ABPG75_012221 [Micractinium tetrahymenae]
MGDELSPRFGKPLAVPANSPPVLELSPMHAVAAPPKLGGQLMKALGAAAPLGPRLQHVKRVRKQEQQGRPPQLEILLCPLDWQEQQQGGGCQAAGQAQPAPGPPDGEQPQVESQVAAPAAADAEADTERPLLPEAVKAIVQQHGLQPYTVQVPLYAPLTREQLAEWSAHWPLTWRPPDAATAPHLQELPAEEDAGPGPRPYLCTGYDAYLVHEPCVMCAMALVHSRLRRVAFCLPSGRWGALGGAYALHAQRSLNHHYQVYRLPLQP